MDETRAGHGENKGGKASFRGGLLVPSEARCEAFHPRVAAGALLAMPLCFGARAPRGAPRLMAPLRPPINRFPSSRRCRAGFPLLPPTSSQGGF